MRKIVVVLCTHNGEKYLDEQLKSILNQSVNVDSIYIYDFNSSDSTNLIIEKYKNNLTISKLNYANGACDSFFYAISDVVNKIDENDLVLFSDQDDIWMIDKVECQLNRYDNLSVDKDKPIIVFHDINIVDSELNIINPFYFKGKPNVLPRDINFDSLIFGNSIIGHTILSNYTTIKMLSEIKNKDKYAMHDWALVLYASIFGEIIYVPKKLTLYRQHENNVLGASGTKKAFNFFRFYNYSKLIAEQAFIFFQENKGRLIESKYKYLVTGNKLLFKVFFSIYGIIFAPTVKKKILSLLILFNFG